MRHQETYLIVIAADKCGPFIPCNTTVCNNHRNTGSISSGHGGLNLLSLVGADNQQIDPLANKTVYLGTLQLVAAVGDTARERHIRM